MWIRISDNKKLELVKVIDKTTAVFKDANGTEFVLTMDEVEVAKNPRRCDLRNIR